MSLDLANSRLLIPSLQPEPLPIAKINASPCTLACPAGINVKAYVSQIAEGRFADALETVRRRCPLPGICGRICHHPCEKACKRARTDEAVAIRSLKRFVADHERALPVPAAVPVTRKESIAIIGSGPAGLTAAYDLRNAGYAVTVFEAENEPGGMLRYGIADYRLPSAVLDFEIDVIRAAGVEIVTNTRIESAEQLLGGSSSGSSEFLGVPRDTAARGTEGPEDPRNPRTRGTANAEEPRTRFAAVLVAIGAQRGNRLPIEGDSIDALSFLRRVKLGDRTPVRGRVIVVGGGSTAVEAARTALRLGARTVEIFYRRYREELLADDEEVAAAEAEGVRFRFLIAPRLRTKRGLQCVHIGLGAPDSSGRRRPIEIPGSEFMVDCDVVLAAVGQSVDWPVPIEELAEMPGVFVAGDAVTGPATVIDAIAGGHIAADKIRSHLEETPPRERQPERRAPAEYELPDAEPLRAERVAHPAVARAADGDFGEVEATFSDSEAIAEARRCLRCGPCGECRTCATSCNRRHVMVRTEEGESFLLRTPSHVALALSADRSARGELVARDGLASSIEILPVRSRLTAERCRSCGRCIDVCPFHALSLNGTARLDPALCRGCGLCSAVCPTTAAMQSALSPEWWSDRVGQLPAADTLVLACQRRAGALEGAPNVLRFRCVGQLDAGMLLEVSRQPFRRILIAGCTTARCRFTNGALRAMEQIERARVITGSLGLDGSRFVADWSPDRAGDRLRQGGE